MQPTRWILGVLFVIAGLSGCHLPGNQPLFSRLSSKETGVYFANVLKESDTLNALTQEYLYNGGGVGVGDFNRDGLADLFFSGNMVSAKLYLNKGNMQFKDVTIQSGTQTNIWGTGVTVVDVNQDGWPDIYLSVAGQVRESNQMIRANKLFINQGPTVDSIPRFREMAAAYGLDDTGYTTQSAFFDYDHDGDLDVYLCTNALETTSKNLIHAKLTHGEARSTDRLYRNEGVENGHPYFRNVSMQAGVTIEGYGLGLAISDLNQDGWLDVYVANDFLSNDLVWINNQHGAFTNQADTYLKHQSYNAMGVDIADINNDTLPEIMVVDMLPASNERRKMMLMKYNYDFYEMARRQNYQDQYIRNTLQLNNGFDSTGKPLFAEIGQLAGVSQTDWSWAPLLADFDNDGYRDLIISNGYRRDITNLDFVTFLQETNNRRGNWQEQKKQHLDALYQLPAVKIHNYAFKNQGNLSFSDQSDTWGLSDPTFSNGAAYADLDNDGDLDLVFNNLDEEAGIYQNTLNDQSDHSPNHHWIRFQLPDAAVGTQLILHLPDGQLRYAEYSTCRGFQSSVEPFVHIGLGNADHVTAMTVKWADGRRQEYQNLAANRLHRLWPGQNLPEQEIRLPPTASPLFSELNAVPMGLDYIHREDEFIDFKSTALLIQQYSKGGPCAAVADVDGNGLDDIFFGGEVGQPRFLYRQTSKDHFQQQGLFSAEQEDTGALFLDVDGDGDQDLYVVSGGSRREGESSYYQDRLYLNNSCGTFTLAPASTLPSIQSSGSCAVAADFDQDGDMDIFRAGRMVPGKYPNPARSYLLRNDGGKYTDVTAQIAPQLTRPGLVCAALWTDFDKDGWVDLAITGEWMPLIFYKNQKGKFTMAHQVTNPDGTLLTGWFNSICGADFDLDGDVDYLLGNFGQNSKYQTQADRPLEIHAADYDLNGRMDPVMVYYNDDKQYPLALRDVMIDQMVAMRKRFPTYAEYAKADYPHTFTREEAHSATIMAVRTLASQYVENTGATSTGLPFRARPLPIQAQFSTVYGLQSGDFNDDGLPDAILVGNNYALDPQTGRNDASFGTVLLGDGKGNFRPLSPSQSGIYADGDARSLVQIGNLFIATNNNRAVQIFRQNRPLGTIIPLQPHDIALTLFYRNGRRERRERYWGSGYLSQSESAQRRSKDVTRIEISDKKGKNRRLL